MKTVLFAYLYLLFGLFIFVFASSTAIAGWTFAVAAIRFAGGRIGATEAFSAVFLSPDYVKRGAEDNERAYDYCNNFSAAHYTVTFSFLSSTALCFLFARTISTVSIEISIAKIINPKIGIQLLANFSPLIRVPKK